MALLARLKFFERWLLSLKGTREAQTWNAKLRQCAAPLEPIDAQSLLVVAPHQDDETLGCGGLIARKIRAGASVHVVYTTDGSGSPTLPSTERAATTARRNREAETALGLLGVAKENIIYLNGPDGGMHSLSDVASEGIVTQLKNSLARLQPAQIAVTFRHDVHPDHEATYRLTVRAIEENAQPVELLEYPIWSLWYMCPENCTQTVPPGLCRVDVRSALMAKRQALQCFPSQLSLSSIPRPGKVPAVLVRRLTGPNEIYFSSNLGTLRR